MKDEYNDNCPICGFSFCDSEASGVCEHGTEEDNRAYERGERGR